MCFVATYFSLCNPFPSLHHIVWREQCPPAINTTNSIADLVLRGEIDMVYHSGDISYANGYLSGWDFFLDMVSPISGMFYDYGTCSLTTQHSLSSSRALSYT